MIKIIYITLKLLEIIIFYLSGKQLSKTKTNKNYWKMALFPMIIFTFVEGFRFGRMIDYNLYAVRYFTLGNGIEGLDKEYEPLFDFIFTGSYTLGIPYSCFIALQCLFLIFSILHLFSNFKKTLPYALPFVLSLIMMNENFIRWYMGFSFVILSISYIIQNKLIKSTSMLICACLTHIGCIFFIPFIWGYNLINRELIKPSILSIIYILAVLVFSISSMQVLVTMANVALSLGTGSLDPSLEGYLSHMDLIISGEQGNMGMTEWGISKQIRVILSFLPIIYITPKTLQDTKYGYYIYNLSLIGILLTPLFSKVELLGRYSDAFLFFSSISGGIMYYYVFSKKVKINKLLYWICIISFIFNIYPYIGNALSRSNNNEMLFIWDANGREYLL